MRSGPFFLTLAVILGLGVDTGAQQPLQVQPIPTLTQQQQAASFLTGVNPQTKKLVPIDVSKAMQPLNNVNKTFRPLRPPAPFTLSQFFPKVTLPSWPPKKAVTPVLPQSPFSNITPVPIPKK
jgi:hypothetical protein